jgi:hypothetical protein
VTIIFAFLMLFQTGRPHELTQQEMPAAVEKQLRTGLEDDGACRVTYTPDQTELSFRQQFSVKRIDLDGDGKPEFLVQGHGNCQCSPTGNCSYWIFKLKDETVTTLLETAVVQQAEVLKRKTNGYNVIDLFSHGSATEQGVRRFTFDPQKQRYVPTRCWSQDWEKDGRILKKPIIEVGKCNEEDNL